MFCSRCGKRAPAVETPLHLAIYDIQGDARRIDCAICCNFLAAKLNGEVVDVRNVCGEKSDDGWMEVRTNHEKFVYYVLGQIVYPEVDTPRSENFESLYGFPDDSDRIFLRWERGRVVGFYTVKPKGTEIMATRETYTMPVLDTAYIRSEYRRKGFGCDILSDIVQRFPNEDIGFSRPISQGMLEVLKSFLTKRREYRLCFWEVADCDVVGSQQLIWYRLRQRRV